VGRCKGGGWGGAGTGGVEFALCPGEKRV
jgi:hypothetical protein